MWSSAPDGGCVGTGEPAARAGCGEVHGRAEGRPPDMGDNTTDLWRISMVRTPDRPGPPGSRDGRADAACHDRRVMSVPPPSGDLPLGSDGYPAAGDVTRRPVGADESARA